MQHLAPLVVILAVFGFLALRARNTHFECPNCGHAFKVSGFRYAIAPHMGFRRYVTCPNCGTTAMMTPIND